MVALGVARGFRDLMTSAFHLVLEVGKLWCIGSECICFLQESLDK